MRSTPPTRPVQLARPPRRQPRARLGAARGHTDLRRLPRTAAATAPTPALTLTGRRRTCRRASTMSKSSPTTTQPSRWSTTAWHGETQYATKPTKRSQVSSANAASRSPQSTSQRAWPGPDQAPSTKHQAPSTSFVVEPFACKWVRVPPPPKLYCSVGVGEPGRFLGMGQARTT